MSLNFSPGTVFHMDNLDALSGMNSETVDLIATDPPFNTGRNRESVGGKYVDQWRWGDNVHPIWMDHIRDDNRALVEVVEGAMHAHSKNLGAFLCFLGVRLLEMKRVLKPTGSIYLHCDPTASHYIKAAMDAVFGMKNFRNEIVWKRLTGGSGRSRNRFSRVHDLIYFYAMGNKSAFNTIYEQYSDEHIQSFYRHEDARGPFGLGDLTAKGPRSGSSGKPWRGIDIGAKSKHWYAPAAFPLGVKQPANWDDMSSQEKLDFLDDNGLIYWPSKVGGMPRFKRYLSVGKGTPMSDMVLDISPIQGSSKEKTGYPDQKPIPLYERLILAASKPGDLVLDPFCGCGTTIMAAKKNNRLWVGIDRSDYAREMVLCSLAGMKKDQVEKIREQTKGTNPGYVDGLLAKYEAVFTSEPPTRTDEGQEAAPTLAPVFSAKERSILTHTQMRQILFDQFGPHCWGCDFIAPEGERGIRYLELDHVNPKSGGGSDHLDNRALLCGPCNKDKSDDLALPGLRRRTLGNKRAREHPIDLAVAGQWCRQRLQQEVQN